MMKKIIPAMLALLTVVSLASCGKTEPKKEALTSVRFLLDWTPNTNHTGLYVAKEKGYYKEEGLDVSIQYSPEGSANELVLAGKAEFGISAQDTLAPAYASKDPLPVSNVAAILQHNTSGIISRKGEGMDRPKGLEGHKYSTWNNPVEQAMLKDVVTKDGGDFSKVTLVPNELTDEVAGLKSKVTDAVWVYYGWSCINAEVQKFPFDYFAFRDINPVFDYYTPTIIAADSYLKEHEDTAKRFLRATAKGYEYAAKHPEEAAAILMKNADGLNKDLVEASQKWISRQYLDEEGRFGTMEEKRWNAFYQWLNDEKLVSVPLKENQGLRSDLVPSKPVLP